MEDWGVSECCGCVRQGLSRLSRWRGGRSPCRGHRPLFALLGRLRARRGVAQRLALITQPDGVLRPGGVWTWVTICADTKLVPAWLVGQRTIEDGLAFMYDLKDRMPERIQLSTDGHQAYRGSVPYAFDKDEVDWAQIHKIYKSQAVAPGRYSPPACTGTKVTVRLGDPDPSRISTSYVERQNLTMRMGMRGLHA
jgi:hypothetical protein